MHFYTGILIIFKAASYFSAAVKVFLFFIYLCTGCVEHNTLNLKVTFAVNKVKKFGCV